MFGQIFLKRIVWPAVLPAVAVCCAFAAKMPPHSYLNSPVTNTTELVAEVKDDDVVTDRYMRHFGMSREQLTNFLSHLHIGRLTETKRYTIYFAKKGGYLDMRLELLKAGRKVFMNDRDEPILVMSCGNPMIAPKGTPASMIRVAPLNSDVVKLADIPASLEPEAYQEAAVVEPGVSPLPEIASIPVDLPGAAPQIIPFLNEAVGALAFLPLVGGKGGGGQTPPRPPVPEPAGFAVVAVGLASAGYLRKRSQ